MVTFLYKLCSPWFDLIGFLMLCNLGFLYSKTSSPTFAPSSDFLQAQMLAPSSMDWSIVTLQNKISPVQLSARFRSYINIPISWHRSFGGTQALAISEQLAFHRHLVSYSNLQILRPILMAVPRDDDNAPYLDRTAIVNYQPRCLLPAGET